MSIYLQQTLIKCLRPLIPSDQLAEVLDPGCTTTYKNTTCHTLRQFSRSASSKRTRRPSSRWQRSSTQAVSSQRRATTLLSCWRKRACCYATTPRTSTPWSALPGSKGISWWRRTAPFTLRTVSGAGRNTRKSGLKVRLTCKKCCPSLLTCLSLCRTHI